MDKTTIIMSILSALLSGGFVFALQLWINKRNRIRDDKVQIFKTLMQMRYLAVSHEKTKALNSIHIIFYKSKSVLLAWEKLHEAYAVDFTDKTEEEKTKLKNIIDEQEIVLLEKMAKDLGYSNLNWTIIKKSYIPVAINRDILAEMEYKANQSELMYLHKEIAKKQYREVVENNSIEIDTKLKKYQLIKEEKEYNENNVDKYDENVGE